MLQCNSTNKPMEKKMTRHAKLYIEDIAKLAPKAQEIIDTVYW